MRGGSSRRQACAPAVLASYQCQEDDHTHPDQHLFILEVRTSGITGLPGACQSQHGAVYLQRKTTLEADS